MSRAEFLDHMATGQTHVCQCWMIMRTDGAVFGFTDHDRSLSFVGVDFIADSGMSASALAASTGLSVNNSEAVGLLQSTVIDPVDIAAGRFDGAEVVSWLVQWDNVEARQVKFRGKIGEITRRSGSFEAELRGLTDALNQPLGRSFLKNCSAILGDAVCRFNTNDPQYRTEAIVQTVAEGVIGLPAMAYQDSWFTHGRLTVLDGAGVDLVAAVKHDRQVASGRELTLWEPVSGLAEGDTVLLVAGCDKRAQTCREKFSNFANFSGFPHIPGDDWLASVPRSGSDANGGSMQG